MSGLGRIIGLGCGVVGGFGWLGGVGLVGMGWAGCLWDG
jgi:hypothetical protein